MLETSAGVYERQWSARSYLEQYYSTGVTSDDVASTRFALLNLRTLGRRFEHALEFGCGPTIHHAMPLSRYVDRFTLADYMLENLEEVRLWLSDSPAAFQWDQCLSGMLAIEQEFTGTGDTYSLAKRKACLRKAIVSLARGNVLHAQPLGHGARYNLVSSHYCLEALGLERREWAACLARLCRLVHPGGVLLLAAMRRCRTYRVFDKEFAVTPIDEADFVRELPRLGFPLSSLRIEIAPVPEFTEEGFDSVCCVFGLKSL